MTGKNNEFLAVYPDKSATYWAFIIPSAARTCENQADEMLSRYETIASTFEEFIKPTRIELLINRVQTGHVLPASIEDSEWLGTSTTELKNTNGISSAEVRDASTISDPGDRWIPRIFVPSARVKVRLADGDLWADRTDHTVEYRNGDPLDREPTVDPIQVSLLHHQNQSYPGVSSEFVNSVKITPFSDIWFEETEMGSTNREYLRAFLQRVDEALNVEEIDRVSANGNRRELEEIY